MENRPTIDVIVPNYNYGRYLHDAIDSLLGQTCKFGKIIVVDDGSTDDSVEIINSFGESIHPIFIPNGGQLGACLAGLKASSSSYVYFMDADDIAGADLVESVIPYLSSKPAKVQFRLSSMNESGESLGNVFPSFPALYTSSKMQIDNEALGFHVSPPTSGLIFSVEALQSLQLDGLSRRDFIDGVPNLLMPYVGEVLSISKPLAHYRVHSTSHSKWGRPDEKILQAELTMYRSRWKEASDICETAKLVSFEKSAFVLERSIMSAALQDKTAGLSITVNFATKIARSHLQPKLKLLTILWAFLFHIYPASKRHGLVLAKRSPHGRPRILDRIFRARSKSTS